MSSTESNDIPVNRENIRLIYLDHLELNSEVKFNLLKLNPSALFYTNIHLCIENIKTISNEKIFLIISNVNILNSIHYLSSIITIFIYKTSQDINQLREKYPKVVNAYADINDLIKSIDENIQFLEKQFFIYTLFNSEKKSSSFIWYNMLLNILKQIKSQNDFVSNKLLSKCSDYYRNNANKLNEIELFQQNYTRDQAIQWYSSDSFLYKLLNRALYTKDIEYLYIFRYFLIDLCFSIEKEYDNMKTRECFIVYRKQMMTSEEIEIFKKNIGNFLSINCFLLTTREENCLSESFSINTNVIFEIHVDFSLKKLTFADISSKYVLLNINSLFKIDSINFMNNLWNIKISACNDDMNYSKLIEKEIDYHNPMIYFGEILTGEFKEVNQAKTYFQILLQSLSKDHKDIPKIYIELGNIYDKTNEYKTALDNYQYALDIYQNELTKDYISIAIVLNMIGMVYKHMRNIDRATDYCQQSLDIYNSKCLNDEKYFQRADAILNLGSIFKDKNDYDTALNYLTQSYNIRCDALPNDHPLLANSLIHIGDLYHAKNDYNQALDYYQQALSIQEISFLEHKSNKSNTIRKIGLIYRDKHEWANALNYFHHSLKIRQDLFPSINHPATAICYGDIGIIHEKMSNLDLALNYYQQQYNIEEQYLSINHPNLLIHFEWIINILKMKDQSEKAIEYCEKKLESLKVIFENTFENHPQRAHLLMLIATIHEDKTPREADQYYQKAFRILDSNKNAEMLPKYLSTMTNFYWKCRMFDRALICQMKLLHLRRTTLPSNHNDIAYTLRHLARLYRAMNKSIESLDYFNQSLNILQKNHGSQHIDVKNIEKEIFDLKDIIKSISSSPKDDYNNRRISNAHKELLIIPKETSKSSTSSTTSTFNSKSTTCLIL